MPTFNFTDPSGKAYSVNGPDGATPEQAFAILQQHLGSAGQKQQASAGLQSYAASKPAAPAEPPKDLSWGDVASQAWQNAPKSAIEFGKGMAQPFIHPVETLQSLGNVEAGALQKAGVMSGKEYVPTADAVGTYFKDRYGSVDGFKKAIATDPVGVATDLSILVSGGGTALAKAPGIVGKVGEVVRAVGDVANPIGLAGKVVGNTAKGIGYGASEIIGGLGTHTGGDSLRLAAGAGFEGGDAAKALRENMRGAAPMEDAVNDARSALGKIRQERGSAYRQGMGQVGSDPTVLDFTKIDAAVQQASAVKRYKGQSLSPSTQAISDKITEAVTDWRKLDPAQFHTAEGLDALKQKLGDIRDATQYGTPERFAADRVYQAVRKTIVDQAPKYANIMKGYESASKEIKEIERTLSLNPNASVDTSLRKLQSVLRDNVNTSYGQRRVLAEYLVKAGAPHLMERLAGQSLKPWTARGLGKLGMQLGAELAAGGMAGGAAAASAGAAAAGAIPAAVGIAATLPLMSPRLMGETAYLGGRAASPLKVLGAIPHPVAAGNAAFQAGRAARVTNYTSNQLSGMLPQKDAATLDAALQSGTPLAAQIRSSLDKWGQASVTFRGSQTPKSMAQFLIATRNLSKNLADAGINIDPDSLISASVDPSQKPSKGRVFVTDGTSPDNGQP